MSCCKDAVDGNDAAATDSDGGDRPAPFPIKEEKEEEDEDGAAAKKTTISAMAFASLSPTPSLHLTPQKHSTIKRKTLVVRGDDDLQSRSKQQQASLTCRISRRDAMLCIPAALVAPFIPTDPAEALSRKAENKRKVREKLEKLREKAGVPKEKEKTESGPEKKEKMGPNSLTVLPSVEASL